MVMVVMVVAVLVVLMVMVLCSDCNLGGGGLDGGSPVLEVKDLRR